MPSREPVEISIVGHYCHDTLVSKEGTFQVLGGSVAYGGAVLSAAGVRLLVISKVGADFRYRKQIAAEPTVVPGARTTSFVDDYTHGERVSSCEAVCEPIHPEDVVAPSEIAIACGIAGEVPPETIARLRSLSRVLLADVQGLIRSIGPRGEVAHLPLSQTPFANSVDDFDYLKVSAGEARALDLPALCRRTRVIVTEGAGGCTLHDGGRELHVPAFPVEERDSTGAGDCFLAGFALGLLRKLSIARALALANYCGAQAVATVGIPRFDPQSLLDRL
jgi:1D-myo-inositol 3-kinase